MSKTLYILINDGGDGSYNNSFTLSKEWIDAQKEKYDNDELEHGETGVDGDGFHYSEIQVPDDATYESLGIFVYGTAEYDWEKDS